MEKEPIIIFLEDEVKEFVDHYSREWEMSKEAVIKYLLSVAVDLFYRAYEPYSVDFDPDFDSEEGEA